MEPQYAALRNLVWPMRPGGLKDDYWKDATPRLPLSFERVNEGQAPRSNALLLQLPLEILGAITQCLHPSSLPSLALVNRDCCQLARSRRFAIVRLDYGHDSLFLLDVLLREASERLQNNGLTRHPSLGACIRRIQVVVDPVNMTRHHDLSLTASFHKIDDSATAERMKEAYDGYFGSYLATIESILPTALPHLESLNWRDRIFMPASMFTALACSSIQHLKLSQISTDGAFDIQLPGTLARRNWPLRSLHLELHWSIGRQYWHRPLLLFASILRLCAATLETLTLRVRSRDFCGEEVPRLDFEGLQPPEFPHLREVDLGDMLVSSSLLRRLLCSEPHSRLQVLEVDNRTDDVRSEFFDSCGTIPSLETFVWSAHSHRVDDLISFLRTNSQLLKLSLLEAQTPSFLEEKLLPLLSGSFRKLTSLQLTWYGYSIPESALEQIATLQSLRQLSLSAGDPIDRGANNWLIHHPTMRFYLEKLQNLRKIAFDRDCSYFSKISAQYRESIAPISDGDEEETGEDAEDSGEDESAISDSGRSRSWECRHRRRVLLEADRYCRILPELQWLHLGQIPIGIVESAGPGEGKKAIAYPLESAKRDLMLRRMFGRENAAPEIWE
jgi:hypothetical protein